MQHLSGSLTYGGQTHDWHLLCRIDFLPVILYKNSLYGRTYSAAYDRSIVSGRSCPAFFHQLRKLGFTGFYVQLPGRDAT